MCCPDTPKKKKNCELSGIGKVSGETNVHWGASFYKVMHSIIQTKSCFFRSEHVSNYVLNVMRSAHTEENGEFGETGLA